MVNVVIDLPKVIVYDWGNEKYIYDSNQWELLAETVGDALDKFKSLTGISFVKGSTGMNINGDLLLVSNDVRMNGYRVNMYIRRLSSRFSYNFSIESDLGYVLKDGDILTFTQLC